MLYSAQLQGNFVSRIDMKIPALFAPAAQECDGFRILPQHSATFAFGFHVVDDALEIDRYEFFHGPTITPIKPSRQQPRRLSTNLTIVRKHKRTVCRKNSVHLQRRYRSLSNNFYSYRQDVL